MTLTIAYVQVDMPSTSVFTIVSSIPGVCLRNESSFKPLHIYVQTFCLTKTRNVQTNVNFGWKMSDVRPLFQALGDVCGWVSSSTMMAVIYGIHRDCMVSVEIVGDPPANGVNMSPVYSLIAF